MGVEVYVYAVEKNPNAIITLQHRVATEDKWKSRVELVAQDMRSWQPASSSSPSFQADLIVSELLGSWADNECMLATTLFASRHGSLQWLS